MVTWAPPDKQNVAGDQTQNPQEKPTRYEIYVQIRDDSLYECQNHFDMSSFQTFLLFRYVINF